MNVIHDTEHRFEEEKNSRIQLDHFPVPNCVFGLVVSFVIHVTTLD